ncbi:hypothetical protein SEVIR_1G238234v4 [Setaria viridis]
MGHLDHRRIDFVLAPTLLGPDFIPFMWQTECVCQASRFVDLVVGGVQLRCYVIHLRFLHRKFLAASFNVEAWLVNRILELDGSLVAQRTKQREMLRPASVVDGVLVLASPVPASTTPSPAPGRALPLAASLSARDLVCIVGAASAVTVPVVIMVVVVIVPPVPDIPLAGVVVVVVASSLVVFSIISPLALPRRTAPTKA